MRKVFICIAVIIFFFVGLFAYDLVHGQKKEPTFYHAFGPFCSSAWSAITLPPVGIFLCPRDFFDNNLRRHELVHWEQYRHMSTLGFYTRYLTGWARAGFNYSDNWMEQEARSISGE